MSISEGSRRRKDAGAVTVEFALIFPAALLLVGALFVFGMHALWSALGDYAARDVARYASIALPGGKTYPADSAVATKAGDEFGVLGAPTAVSRTVTKTGSTAGEGDVVTVTVTYKVPGVTAFTSLINVLPGLGGLDLTPLSEVTHTATARLE